MSSKDLRAIEEDYYRNEEAWRSNSFAYLFIQSMTAIFTILFTADGRFGLGATAFTCGYCLLSCVVIRRELNKNDGVSTMYKVCSNNIILGAMNPCLDRSKSANQKRALLRVQHYMKT